MRAANVSRSEYRQTAGSAGGAWLAQLRRRTAGSLPSLTLAVCVALTGMSASAQSPDAIDILFEAIAMPGGKTARFHEMRRFGDLDIPIESTGRLSFEPPDRLEKHTLQPVDELMRLDSRGLAVTIGGTTRELAIDTVPAAAALATALRGLFAGQRADVEKTFEMTLTQDAADWTLRLTPRDAAVARSIATIEIQGEAKQMGTIIITQYNGDESQMQILPAP